VRPNLVGDLAGELRAGVVHRQQESRDAQLGVEGPSNALGVAEQLAEALEGVVLALDGDDQIVRGGQRVDRQQPQRWRAVEEHHLVVPIDPLQGFAEFALARHRAHQLHLGPR
jgi:hypothetical protein